ncbi:RagB/SusD family nutrient uptake outer membrane protein [Sphingobacterium corticibacterium]|uniref:RagB/SusD family nutrient uptake outer membrane protein n=1 Tax=Sphingobacterium corticibacterium TaxID=2484746 RepID=A0A4Q6XNZ8_9SPHI|nr:RagB/SusD family nutrient uptake outer membrane protein [Sphingobacterium corticibacterium]RZF57454.1 RagB/SusD family nutrient uptake outer membrane protein [Sphingobacterium corticibacterium]
MKRNIIKSIAYTMLVSSTLVQTRCNKILDLDPLVQIADGNYWQSAKDFQLFANDFYSYRRGFSAVVSDAPHSDLRSDLIKAPDPNVFSNGTNTIPASDGNYSGAFSRIRAINMLLQKAAEYSRPEEIAQYVAEAHFFRAYVYFDLLQLYGNAQIIEDVLDVSDPILYGPRNNRTEVADFIIADLQKAIPGLPLESDIATADKGRVSRGAAQAFLSRVALFEGTWQKFRSNTERGSALLDIAARSARDVINSAQYELFKPAVLGDSAQKYLFILEDEKSNPASITKSANREYIFSNRYDEVLNRIGINISRGQLANVVWVTRKFANMYLSQNGLPIDHPDNAQFEGYATMTSEYQNRDNRMKYTLMPPKQAYWVNFNPRVTWLSDAADLASAIHRNYIPASTASGYNNQKWASEREVQDAYEGFDFPIIRYAEVLLNYAEAVYERDGAISDDDLNISLNLVRNRVNADMPRLSNAFVGTHDLNMRVEIRRERTIELYNEGFRIDDLKRWKTAEVEMPQIMLGIKWEGTEYQTTTTNSWNTVSRPRNADGILIMESGRSWTEKNYLYPIPADQLRLNPELGQNPDW